MCGIDLRPGFDNGENFGRRKVGESEIMGWREGDHVAFSCDGIGAQEDI